MNEENEFIQDPVLAAEGAYAEKPLRDVAREPETIPDEREVLDRVAERESEKAIRREIERRARNPFQEDLDRSTARFEEQGDKYSKEQVEMDRLAVQLFERYKDLFDFNISELDPNRHEREKMRQKVWWEDLKGKEQEAFLRIWRHMRSTWRKAEPHEFTFDEYWSRYNGEREFLRSLIQKGWATADGVNNNIPPEDVEKAQRKFMDEWRMGHKEHIKKARDEHKAVPSKVLDEYPDLSTGQ